MISVVSAVYNQEKYIEAAIRSVLRQTFKDFEYILIDDGSTDNSVALIRSFKDSRIRLIQNDANLKLPASLNRGFALARGKYIVRFDTDDICMPRRFAEQVKFMENNPQVDVCGSWIRYFGERLPYRAKLPAAADVNRCLLLFVPTVAHSAIILRHAKVLDLGIKYSENYMHAEDYELWLRHSLTIKVCNIKKTLVHYRVHRKQVTQKHLRESDASKKRAQREFFANHGWHLTDVESETHLQLSTCRFNYHPHLIGRFSGWVETLSAWNRRKKLYPVELFDQVLVDRWLRAASRFPKHADFNCRQVKNSVPGRNSHIPISRRCKYYAKRHFF